MRKDFRSKPGQPIPRFFPPTVLALSVTMIFGLVILMSGMSRAIGVTEAINLSAPPSLKFVPVPEPLNLNEFVRDRNAAVRLGKALYWDMQLGSDGIQACASCHFQAGADIRIKNQLNPGLPHSISGTPHPNSTTFELGAPNSLLRTSLFPFPPSNQGPLHLVDDDVVSSQGVFNRQFIDIVPGSAVELCNPVPDPIFHVGGVNVRRVAGRNTPPAVNAVFNIYQFWDGRANDIFNGVNPFGRADVNARILVNGPDPVTGVIDLVPTKIALKNSSLASQAVGPPLSDFEMSCAGRTFPKVGKKMLSLTPLGRQLVHPLDGVLGSLSRAAIDSRGRAVGTPGLSATYVDMIKAAFQPKYWNSDKIVTFPNGVMTIGNSGTPRTTDEFTQMEANFSFFFGLALQVYESTLVSDDTPFDRFQEGDSNALTAQQQRGLNFFLTGGKCIECHRGPLFTAAAEGQSIERMIMGDLKEGFYDSGFYNIAVTLNASHYLGNGDTTTDETYDIGRGGTDPFGNPLSNARLGFLKEECILDPAQCALDPAFAPFVDPVGPCVGSPCDIKRVFVDGTFKTPGLRNVELTGPYFHNGFARTLQDMLDHYDLGGLFREANILNLSGALIVLSIADPTLEHDLTAFLKALTDERVRNESAPFDHPQLFVPNGHPGDENGLTCVNGLEACDALMEIPAVGAAGRIPLGLVPLRPFLSGRVIGDFDGDHKADIAVYRAHNGSWFINPSSGSGSFGGAWGGDPTDQPVPGDYDGDGITDSAVYRGSSGTWFVIPSLGAAPFGMAWGGDPTDEPVPEDYDGDGITDFAVYRASAGVWYVIPSSGTPGPYAVGWGGDATDKPVPADYDGDRIADIAVYRTSAGVWYIIPSSGTPGPYAVGWGGDATDKPVPADYDGDGKTDIAVYRAGNSVWFIIPSTGAAPYAVGWGGNPTDKPVPADYDGDGKTDVTVYRGNNGVWFVVPSAGASPFAVGWGGHATDIPVTTLIP